MAHSVLLEFVNINWALQGLNLIKFLLPRLFFILFDFLETFLERFIEWFVAIFLDLSYFLLNHFELFLLLLLLLLHHFKSFFNFLSTLGGCLDPQHLFYSPLVSFLVAFLMDEPLGPLSRHSLLLTPFLVLLAEPWQHFMSLLACFWVFDERVTPSLTVIFKLDVVALGATISGVMSTHSGSREETRSRLIHETVLLIVFHSCASWSAAQLGHNLVWLTVTVDSLDISAEIPVLLLLDLGAMISFRMVCPAHLLFETSSILSC